MKKKSRRSGSFEEEEGGKERSATKTYSPLRVKGDL